MVASQCQYWERYVEAVGVLHGNCGRLREVHTNDNEGPSSSLQPGPTGCPRILSATKENRVVIRIC